MAVDILLRIVALAVKELRVILKDPANRIILVVPVIIQSLLFGYAATFDLVRVPYALVDRSHGVASAELVARIEASHLFGRVADTASERVAADLVYQGRALMVVSIPPDFEARLQRGENAPVQLVLDARNSTTAATAAAYLQQIAARFDGDRARAAGLAAAPAVDVQVRAWFNPQLETRWNILPALIASLSMLQTLVLTALSVAREREQGTFDQLLVTPLSPFEILVGKAVAPVLVGLVQSTLILLITRFWFGIPMAGSAWAIYASLLVFTLASVGIGLSISAVSANMQQAMLNTFVIVMPLMLLSGLSTPVQTMPHLLQLATYVNPLRFGIDLVRRIYLEGAGLATVAPDFIPLLAISGVTLPLAAWLFRNRLV